MLQLTNKLNAAQAAAAHHEHDLKAALSLVRVSELAPLVELKGGACRQQPGCAQLKCWPRTSNILHRACIHINHPIAAFDLLDTDTTQNNSHQCVTASAASAMSCASTGIHTSISSSLLPLYISCTHTHVIVT